MATNGKTKTENGGQVITADLAQPVILEQDGEPVAVLISAAEYDRWQTLLQSQEQLTAVAARRAADKALFRDLVGCALSSGEPVLVPSPSPRWRVPYHFLPDGALAAIIEVDARTGAVALTDEERNRILAQVEKHNRKYAPDISIEHYRQEAWQAALKSTFGMWAGRNDIANDGVTYVQEIRRNYRQND